MVQFSKKHKYMIYIIFITILLIIVQFVISTYIQNIQNELDDLNQLDSNFNLQYSLISSLKSTISADTSNNLINIHNKLYPIQDINVEQSQNIADNIKKNQNLLFILNNINTFIMTIEMFSVGLLISILFIDKDNPLFVIEERQNNDNNTISVLKIFPKYELKKVAKEVVKMQKGVSAFQKKSSLKDVLLNLIGRKNNAVFVNNDANTNNTNK